MTEKTERLLSNNCAPTILGFKPSSLISVNKEEFNNFYKELFLMKSNKIKVKILSISKNKLTIFIYNLIELKKIINNVDNKKYLINHNYKNLTNLDLLIEEIKLKINKEGITPDIGLFLGIPLDDLIEFEKGNKNYLLLGYWQVFHLKEEKERLFKTFDKCKSSLNNLLNKGKSIEFLLN